MKLYPLSENHGVLYAGGPMVVVDVELSPYGEQTMLATARIVNSHTHRVLMSSAIGRDLSAPLSAIDEQTALNERRAFIEDAREFIVSRFRKVDLMLKLMDAGLV